MADPGPYREHAREPEAREKQSSKALGYALASIAVVPINFVVFLVAAATRGRETATGWDALFVALVLVQLVFGFLACFARPRNNWAIGFGILGILGAPLGAFAWFLSHIDLGGLGGAWGRPLRLRGRVLHPELRAGSDWTRGDRPDVTSLDAPTRAALEALWLHDAQKEHASVPALARVSWLLAAVGAPADLVEAVHVAVLEEIEHARLCFALAAGYGGRSHTVEPMPELLVGGLDLGGDPLVRIAVESLNDGCLLEDFNADVARVCAGVCRDAVVLGVLEKITREERSHAELSWRLLDFALERGGVRVERAIEKALAGLERTARPTAASRVNRELSAHADEIAMRAHGRLADAEWGALWNERLAETRRRVEAMLGRERAAAVVDRVA